MTENQSPKDPKILLFTPKIVPHPSFQSNESPRQVQLLPKPSNSTTRSASEASVPVTRVSKVEAFQNTIRDKVEAMLAAFRHRD